MDDCKPETQSFEHLEMSFVVQPKDANLYGSLHGGVIMLSADNLAYAIAAKFSKENVVTAKISELNFVSPVKVGDMVLLSGDIVRVGNSSMDVRICIKGDKLRTGEVFNVADAMLTMVAVDENGRPKKFVRK
jgi:uncharacterized protein (TIGR00369 family)